MEERPPTTPNVTQATAEGENFMSTRLQSYPNCRRAIDIIDGSRHPSSPASPSSRRPVDLGRPTTTPHGTQMSTGDHGFIAPRTFEPPLGPGRHLSTFRDLDLAAAANPFFGFPQNQDMVGVDGGRVSPSSYIKPSKTRYASTGRVGGMQSRGNHYINISKYCITSDQCGEPNANCHLNVALPVQNLHLSSNYYRMQALQAANMRP